MSDIFSHKLLSYVSPLIIMGAFEPRMKVAAKSIKVSMAMLREMVLVGMPFMMELPLSRFNIERTTDQM